MFRAILKVLRVEIDPMHRDRKLRWIVICKVEKVIQGTLPEGISELTLLVHSSSKTFGDVEIAGKKYMVDFLSPWSQPYTGTLNVIKEEL